MPSATLDSAVFMRAEPNVELFYLGRGEGAFEGPVTGFSASRQINQITCSTPVLLRARRPTGKKAVEGEELDVESCRERTKAYDALAELSSQSGMPISQRVSLRYPDAGYRSAAYCSSASGFHRSRTSRTPS